MAKKIDSLNQFFPEKIIALKIIRIHAHHFILTYLDYRSLCYIWTYLNNRSLCYSWMYLNYRILSYISTYLYYKILLHLCYI
jgi:hypothetical protein